MLKIGILGAGHLGKIHLSILKEMDGVEISGIYDPDEIKARETSSGASIRLFPSMDSLMDASGAVDIVTSTTSHYECAAMALKKLKHCFIEKPIASGVEEAREIVALAQEAGTIVQVGHIERFNPAFTAVSSHLDNPMFIEAHRLAGFTPRGTDVSVIHDLMIHDIDIVLSVVNSSIKRISASGVAVISDTPDIANARIEFMNGCVANLTASRISMKSMRKARFFQRDAYLSIDFLKKEASVIRMKPLTSGSDPFAIIIDPGGDRAKKQLIVENPVSHNDNAIKLELESFVKAILTGTPVAVTASDGLRAVETAQMIVEKMQFTGNLYQ